MQNLFQEIAVILEKKIHVRKIEKKWERICVKKILSKN